MSIIPCSQCDGQFTQTHHLIRYCTDACRQAAKRARSRKPATEQATCIACDRAYLTANPRARYCSKKCGYEYRAALAGKRNCRRCSDPLTETHYARYCQACQAINLIENRKRTRAAGRLRGEAWATGKTHRARAKAYNVPYEPINRMDIYARDGWLCGICSQRINKNLKHPHPMAVSLDHIIPISLGGGHLRANVQAAHWKCNIDKGADQTGAQLLLIG